AVLSPTPHHVTWMFLLSTFIFTATPTTAISTLSLHDALPISIAERRIVEPVLAEKRLAIHPSLLSRRPLHVEPLLFTGETHRDASSSGWFSRSERHREAEGDADREEPIWRAARQAPTNARIEKHVRWRRLPDEADERRVVG